jgi:hypothetical protein
MGFWANLTPFLPWQSIVMIVDRPCAPCLFGGGHGGGAISIVHRPAQSFPTLFSIENIQGRMKMTSTHVASLMAREARPCFVLIQLYFREFTLVGKQGCIISQ